MKSEKLSNSPIFKRLKLESSILNQGMDIRLNENTFPIEQLNHLNELEQTKDSVSSSLENLDQKNSLSSSNLTGYSRIQELKLVKIGIASSEQIVNWAEKILPNGKVFGEVLNANTLHYKTFKPQKGGLFCQRIFGPLKDFECACGIIRKPASEEGLVQNLLKENKPKRTYCSVCDVEYTWSVIRRYQLGYIKLASPVTHLWYLKANPSYLSMLFDFRKKELEEIIYCMQTLTLEDYWRPRSGLQMELNVNLFFESYKKYLFGTEDTLDTQTSANFLARKKKKQKLDRQNQQTRRYGISYIYQGKTLSVENLDPKILNPLASLSKTDQIKSLEMAYKLSTEDYNRGKFSRLTQIARILMEKKILNAQKNLFFRAQSQCLETYYKKYFTKFAKKSFLSFPILDLQVEKQGETKPLKQVLSHYLKNKLKFKEKRSFEQHGSLRWGTGTKYRYFNKTKTTNFNTFPASSIEMSSQKRKNEFLIVLLNLIRKAKPEQNWESIHKNSFQATLVFADKKQENSFKNRFTQFHLTGSHPLFANLTSLYFLFMLQSDKQTKNFSKFLLLEKQDLIQSSLMDSSVSSETLGSLFELLSQETQIESKKFNAFIETKNTLENMNLKKFTNFGFQYLLKIYLLSEFTQRNHFYRKKQFKIFLTSEDNKEYFWQSSSHKLNESNYSGLLNKKKENFSTFKLKKGIETLQKRKKFFQFMNQSKDYPQNSMEYIKNLEILRQNLSTAKHKKVLPAFQLFNRIYTSSYSESWQTEKDWKYFLYYNKAQVEILDKTIFLYRERFLDPSTSNSGQVSKPILPVLGASILQKLLFQYEGLELKKMAKQHQNMLPKLNRYIRSRKQVAVKKSDYVEIQKLLQNRDDLIRRLKLLRKLFKKNTKTSSMVLTTVPVLPPDLRPILKMQNQIAASDLNRFYQRILYRNDRLKKFLRSNTTMLNNEPAFEVRYAQRLLQEAVDNLIQNGKGQVKAETNSRGQPLKSLSEILKGKQGRFRQYLLGKRVDYSGRSVIVVGPALKIYECGLPFEMAMELFLPFLIKRIFQYNLARTVMGAKTILKHDRKTTWHLLEEIMQHHPILLNRAPTLHRLGIQAFQPKLIDGRAILLHPMVCPAFNADFDGDQMAVHVPITVEARTEAWKLMFSRNHLISPATGEPMLLPTQDMVLGCYYLTTTNPQGLKHHVNYPFNSATSFYFSTMKEILQAYLQEKIHLQTPIWMRWEGLLQFDQNTSQPYELRLYPNGSYLEIQSEYHRTWSPDGQWQNLFVRTTAGRIIFNLMVQNCVQKKI